MDSQFYTYAHFASGSQSPFYIGKGKNDRAHIFNGRSQEWKRMASSGVDVKILAFWQTASEAYQHEKFLIACFQGIGAPLANKNAGGSGQSNPKPEVRAKIAKTLSSTLLLMTDVLSERAKSLWADPEFRKKIVASRQSYCDSIRKNFPLTKEEKFAIKSKASAEKMTPEARAKHSAAMRKKWADPAFKKMMLDARKNCES
jgi:hypothetical protein